MGTDSYDNLQVIVHCRERNGLEETMKLVIASDIHGSAKWCREVMNVIEREAPDKVVLLGDLLYHGPRNPLPDEYAPAEVAAMLNGVADRIVSVRGNCEAEVDQVMLQFPCMADYAWIVDGPHQLYCTHGHLREPGSLPPLPNGTAFVYGHFHVRKNEAWTPCICVTPEAWDSPKTAFIARGCILTVSSRSLIWGNGVWGSVPFSRLVLRIGCEQWR